MTSADMIRILRNALSSTSVCNRPPAIKTRRHCRASRHQAAVLTHEWTVWANLQRRHTGKALVPLRALQPTVHKPQARSRQQVPSG
jgi:hypothetical protein